MGSLGDVAGAHLGKGSRVEVFAISFAGALQEFYLGIGVDPGTRLGRSLFTSVRESSAPAVTLTGAPLWMCISGAISQLLMTAFQRG